MPPEENHPEYFGIIFSSLFSIICVYIYIFVYYYSTTEILLVEQYTNCLNIHKMFTQSDISFSQWC